MIFHEWTRDKVFLDSRFEMVYPRRIIEAYLAFAFDRAGASRTLNGFPNDFVLINPKTVAADAMARAAHWSVIYSDSNSSLYARRGSRADGIAGVPVRGAPSAPVFPKMDSRVPLTAMRSDDSHSAVDTATPMLRKTSMLVSGIARGQDFRNLQRQ